MLSSGIQKNSEWMRQPKLRKFYYFALVRELLSYWQIDFESGSLFRLAFYFDSTAVILDDPVTDRQAQSQAALFLCREKRLENLRQIFRSNPETGVGHRNTYFMWRAGSAPNRFRRDGQSAAFGHGVNRVQIQIN